MLHKRRKASIDSTVFHLSRNFKGIESADYTPEYVFNRKLGHKALKLMGDGVGTLEEKITMESECMVDTLEKANGMPVDVGITMGMFVFLIFLITFVSMAK